MDKRLLADSKRRMSRVRGSGMNFGKAVNMTKLGFTVKWCTWCKWWRVFIQSIEGELVCRKCGHN